MGSIGANRNTFKSVDEFEKSLTGINDIRLKEYSDALDEENKYNRGLESVLNQAISEDGYDAIKDTISNELKTTQNLINNMPNDKTPAQLGTLEALQERLKILKKLQTRKGTAGAGRGKVNIVQ